MHNSKGIMMISLYYFAVLSIMCSVYGSRETFPGGMLGYLIRLAYLALFVLANFSHVLCVFSDPGAIPLNYTEVNLECLPIADRALFDPQLRIGTGTEEFGSPLQSPFCTLAESDNNVMSPQKRAIYELVERRCEICQCLKPPRTHHCSFCGRCVVRLDHHCHWTNNCVAYYTQRPFLQFLSYSAGFSTCSILLQSASILYGNAEFRTGNFGFAIFRKLSLVTWQ